VCKDMLMKYKKRREILTDFSENEEGPYYQPKAHEDVFRDTFNEITIEKVLKAIERLSPEDRLLIKLRDIDELSYEEISKIMGKPLGTVKSRLHYARKRLREILEEGEKSVERSPQQNTRW
ncbi:MAG: RNA polymerase sigma factor, partial [Candidatus Syntropharchaeia archaeon]